MIKALAIAWLLLFLGDLLSTFCYHVPEHVFGSLHVKTHHSAKKDFRHYAILTFNHSVLLDGVLGALPYLLLAVLLWSFSKTGVLFGLSFGLFHVWWRHISVLNWKTPEPIAGLCKLLFITTPEQHWLHHQKTSVAFGDIFTVFDRPARIWLSWLRLWRRSLYRHPTISY